uniref:Fe2OG dioxygenase domain-containing protein n=1 Tax=Eutreptiella gymnastica TaxID=73025 RepID=A0A7S1J8X9_9EUGL
MTDADEYFPGQYPLPYSRNFQRFETSITEEHIDGLDRNGFAVVDNFLGTGWATAILTEMQWLYASRLMQPNQIRILDPDDAPFNVTKPNIHELDLHHEDLREKVPEINELFWQSHALAAHLNGLLPRLQLTTRPAQHTLKAQCNTGHGGCFPLHYDNPAPPDKRRLSALLYLNPDWKPGDGGEIVVSPFLGQPTTIEPCMDRLVLFFSETMLHRVLPCYAERYCLTIWLDSDMANKDQEVLGSHKIPTVPGLDADMIAILNKPSVQKQLSRAVYEEEYEESIRQCFAGSNKGIDAMLARHSQAVAGIRGQPELSHMVDLLRACKPKPRTVMRLPETSANIVP